MIWHALVLGILRECGIFSAIKLQGGKIRANIDPSRFLDIHFDPGSHSYSYAFIDLSLPYPGDKRLFGWDDYPHTGFLELEKLSSYPHHFQERNPDGYWTFSNSPFQGEIETEIPLVIEVVKQQITKQKVESIEVIKDPEYIIKARINYPRAYKSWTIDEDTKLKEEYQSGMSIKQIATNHRRKSGAITSRLKKLGLIFSKKDSISN